LEELYDIIVGLKKEKQSSVLMTIISKEGHIPSSIGQKMLLSNDGRTFGTIGGGAIEKLALDEATKNLKLKKSMSLTFTLDDHESLIYGENPKPIKEPERNTGMLCGGKATIFFEFIGVRQTIHLFGAGHVGQAILKILPFPAFDVIVYDDRVDYLEKAAGLLTDLKTVLIEDINMTIAETKFSENDFILILTHSHSFDFEIVLEILQQQKHFSYMGIIASKNKAEILKQDLLTKSACMIDFSKIYCPIGLNISNNNPEEIAVSIVAQILAVKNAKLNTNHLSIF